MKYKVGDRVKYGSEICTVTKVLESQGKFKYRVQSDTWFDVVEDEMIEGLVEEETQPKFKVGDRVITNKGYIGKFEGWVSDYQVKVLFEESGCDVVIHPKDLKLMEEETLIERVDDKGLPFNEWLSHKGAFHIPDGYELKDENGNVINATKIVLEKKKKEYPKTYEECCKILDITPIRRIGDIGYKRTLLNVFEKLLVCRDAYRKIAGDWEPEFRFGKKKYCIMTKDNKVISATVEETNRILVFPTAEMRDAFYENFKREIESCKELL